MRSFPRIRFFMTALVHLPATHLVAVQISYAGWSREVPMRQQSRNDVAIAVTPSPGMLWLMVSWLFAFRNADVVLGAVGWVRFSQIRSGMQMQLVRSWYQ